MLRIIRRVVVNALALYAAVRLVPGFFIQGGFGHYLLAGLVLGLLNLTLRPLLKILSLPLVIITFGLFSIVINMLILWVLGSLVSFVSIAGLSALIWATFVVSTVNTILNHTHL